MYSFSHDDITITVRPAEQDRHTVVFVNGILDGGWMWEHVAAALESRGHGTVVATQPLPAHCTFNDVPFLQQSISSIVDGLSGPPPVLCGTSLGALVAMELAASNPSRYSGVILTGAIDARAELDAQEAFERIDCPILLLCGTLGPISPATRWRNAAATSPDVHFVEIPRCGISPMIEAPDLFTAPVLGWLETVPAPSTLSHR